MILEMEPLDWLSGLSRLRLVFDDCDRLWFMFKWQHNPFRCGGLSWEYE